MSYCRWSSNDWDCDLYCYADVSGGYTTHVAANRAVGDIPKAPWPRAGADDAEWAAYFTAHERQMAFLASAEHVAIGLPHDGESFNDPDLPSFLARVELLKALGYHVPDGVLEEIRAEIAETQGEVPVVRAAIQEEET